MSDYTNTFASNPVCQRKNCIDQDFTALNIAWMRDKEEILSLVRKKKQ